MDNQSAKQEMISFATSDRVNGAIEILKNERTKLSTIITTNEYTTLLNALTLEIEANLIRRFVTAIDSIKNGEIN